MLRHTDLIVYVDAQIMDRPQELFDAVIGHMIKKDLDSAQRKRFIAGYMRASTDQEKVEVIGTWVQVRDMATFPFRNADSQGDNQKQEGEGSDADQKTGGGVPVDNLTDGKQESGAARVGGGEGDGEGNAPGNGGSGDHGRGPDAVREGIPVGERSVNGAEGKAGGKARGNRAGRNNRKSGRNKLGRE